MYVYIYKMYVENRNDIFSLMINIDEVQYFYKTESLEIKKNNIQFFFIVNTNLINGE